MKNIILLDGSNSVMVNGLQKGLREYANVTNLALGATTSIQNLYELKREKNQGLSKASENTYQATTSSGDPIFYTNADGEIIYGAVIRNYTLEMSNVDLGVSLTDMIVMQKMFDASSKSITTADEMIKNAINLKR
ncbi:flagellar basal body rod C-terminal domain-containing protein [Campylobacter devanensis]|uniref:flagellar basal body rod C-terminal domain-containing protein n=1 Tax=Campylobacter devanensis TaxID=3161138 RepID=UPI000A345659|nr:flagellar basal body rod C-terminal domain-containing protein [Campylobacter sp. P0132]